MTFSLSGEIPSALSPDRWERTEQGTISSMVEDIARELPALLAQLSAEGAVVSDLQVEAPTLQEVFIHLTGRELRE